MRTYLEGRRLHNIGVYIPVDPEPPEPEIVKAFPTAYGSGAYTTGGRGGQIVHVTNNNISGAGSFTEAMLMTVPRIIVFDVSGTFPINKLLYLDATNSNFTLAGQTSPDGGVTIRGGRVYFDGVTNYIMRHIRFKGGFEADWVPNSGDNLGSSSFQGVGAQHNIIVDHVSFGFGKTMPVWVKQGGDPAIVDKVTIQNCLFSESDKGAIIGEDVDGVPYYESGDISFARNVFYNCQYRTPNTTGNHGVGNSFDVINNLTWNAMGRMTRSSGNANINHIGNATYGSTLPLTNQNLNLYSEGWTPTIYTNGNYFVYPNVWSPPEMTNTVSELNADNTLSWRYFVGNNYGDQLPPSFFTNTPFPIKGVYRTILDATTLRTTLPDDVGCNKRLNADGTVSSNLDEYDSVYIDNIKNNIFVTPIDNNSYSLNPITPVARPIGFYGTNPHIPQAFLTAKGVTNTLTVHNELAPSGYTWLEEYLNQVDN